MNAPTFYELQRETQFYFSGTTNVGQFAECLNMASLYKLPIVFVVENNLWAIGMYHYRATAPSLGDQARALLHI